jgi:hypothetical protein
MRKPSIPMRTQQAASVCENLDEVFAVGEYFSQTLRSEARELGQLLLQGAVKLSLEQMPLVPEGRWLQGREVLMRREPVDDRDRLPFGAFSGKGAHQAICARAAVWLENRGLDWDGGNTLYYPGGTADVLASDKSIAVEAGYTGAKKVIASLCSDRHVSVLVVPYPREGGVMDVAPLNGYFFEPLSLELLDEAAERARAIVAKCSQDLDDLFAPKV